MRLLLVCVLTVLLLPGLPAQMRFSHLDQRQGLSQNTATAFLKDKEGFVWIGTQDGLNRYDGYTFTVFRRDPKDTNSLCDNYVLSLAEDADGNIWMGTRNGVCAYSKTTGKFHRFYSEAGERSAFHTSIPELAALRVGGIVYCNRNALLLHVALQANGTFSVKTIADSVRTFSYCAATNLLAFPRNKEIRVCRTDGSVQLKHEWKPASQASPVILLTPEFVYINDSTDVLRYSTAQPAAPVKVVRTGTRISVLRADQHQSLWTGTSNGICYVTLPGSDAPHVNNIREDKSDYYALTGNQVESIYISPDGLVWIGTVGGVNIYDPLQERFSIYHGAFADAQKETIWFVLSFGHVTLWAGNEGLSYATGLHTVPRWLQLIPKEYRYSAGSFDSKGRLWLGTKNNGVLIVDTAQQKLVQQLFHHTAFANASVMDIAPGDRGKMWIASIGTLCTVTEDDLQLQFISLRRPGKEIKTNYFTALQKDPAGNMYVASSFGVFHFDATDSNFTQIVNDPQNENSLSYNIVNDLLWRNNKLWMATMGSGIDEFDPATQSFRHFTTANGLANNTVYGIEAGDDDELWLSTNEGLIVLNTVTGTSRNYTTRDGLPSNEYVINKHARNASTGQLFFGSASGLVMLTPSEFNAVPSHVQPVVTRFRVNYSDRMLSADSIVQLGAGERNISFEFSAIDFRNQDKITYSYRLEGFDTAWHSTGAFDRTANYTNLPYGTYTFLVRYKVGGEAWSEQILRRQIVIATPFYATLWFRVLMTAFGITLITLVVRYISQRKLRVQLEELRVQEQIRNEKERISRDLHDNVGAQLTYVISTIDNLSYSLHKQDAAHNESKKLEQLGEFTRGTIDQLRESIWAINSEKISIPELCARWRQQLALLNESRPEFSGKVYHKGTDEILKPGIAIEVHRIVQEAITNAFKHSNGKQVEVHVHSSPALLKIEVKDNGTGMNSDAAKPGHYGLQNMRDRAKNLHATVSFRSGNGTTVTLEVPNN